MADARAPVKSILMIAAIESAYGESGVDRGSIGLSAHSTATCPGANVLRRFRTG